MYIALITEACPDCLTNLDNSDIKSSLTCLITIGIGAVIRYFEIRKIKRRQNNK